MAGLARRALGCATQAVSDIDQGFAALRLSGAKPRAVLLGLAPGDDAGDLIDRSRSLGTVVICVLDAAEPQLVQEALAARADGYLALSSIDAETLAATVAAAEAGECPVAPSLRAPVQRPVITARCLEVLDSLAEGLHDDEIAERLGISTSSVRKHIAGAQARLEARTRTPVVALVARDGLI
jgi:DNA-binding NarL/FixJ family response regulator